VHELPETKTFANVGGLFISGVPLPCPTPEQYRPGAGLSKTLTVVEAQALAQDGSNSLVLPHSHDRLKNFIIG
jgi:hypothetical protein